MYRAIQIESIAGRRLLGACCALALLALCGALLLTAEQPAATASSATATHQATYRAAHHKREEAKLRAAHRHRRRAAVGAHSQDTHSQAVIPAAPPPPQLPAWPVNEKPAAATVTWDSQGLRISATNSSLAQILDEVSDETGAKVEGLNGDERIFGDYGPGPARDVLSQLLQGSGYNILMVGDQGQGTPLKIVLTGRPTGPAPPSTNSGQANDQEDNSPAELPPPQAQQYGPYYGRNMPSRAPQNFNRELQDRQQQMQRMNQMPGQPSNAPQQPSNPQL